ncbi:hypothetical protein DSAG12_00960 [Promethearchaeum syntrophicum]|uniref:Uncharacterized protein n=1 Tax=Promethearchaeum syntrophicum TaxID=2594042 RepID=A0A5B9D8D3_9ARCH|nr:hypothetical protein [Candidatus Prometheoarchaeum syntrophicum]QEE15137.1 Bacterial lipid A biosynthesis acyltransferase [Candidatus Prometheoarchaeum syntrophicum]
MAVTNRDRRLDKNTSMKIHKNFFDYNIFFRITHFIQSTGRHKFFERKSFLRFRFLTIIFGPLIVKKGFPTLENAWKFLYPPSFLEKHNINLKRWALQIISYIFEFFFEITFFMPNHSPKNISRFIKMEGFEHIEAALQKKKGVLVPIIHLGELYHPTSALLRKTVTIDNKTQKVEVVGIVSPENEFLLRQFLKMWDNVFAIVTGKFSDLEKEIEKHLKQNRVVFVMHDYFNKHQNRVPFIFGKKKYDFLIPFPQLLAYFHNKYGIPVIPSNSFPQKDMSRSLVKFYPPINMQELDPLNEPPLLREEVLKLRKGLMSEREKNSLLALKINQVLYPSALEYPFYWQMVYTLFKRSQFRIYFDDITTYFEFYTILLHRLKQFMEKTYEPERKDKEIFKVLEKLTEEIELLHKDPKAKILFRKKYIEIGLLSSKAAFNKAVSIALARRSIYIKKEFPNLQVLFLELVSLFD